MSMLFKTTVCLLGWYVVLASTAQKCPPGYDLAFESSCYMLSHDRETWTGAMISCHIEDGYLAEIDSENELSFLRQSLVKEEKNVSRWVGITNKRIQTEWEWATSRRVFDNSFPLWSPGEPDMLAGNQDESCGLLDYIERLHHVYSLADVQCDRLEKYLCETSKNRRLKMCSNELEQCGNRMSIKMHCTRGVCNGDFKRNTFVKSRV